MDDDQVLCRVHVQSSPFPVDAEVKVDKNGPLEKTTAFYVRVANGTKELGDSEKAKYIAGRWPG